MLISQWRVCVCSGEGGKIDSGRLVMAGGQTRKSVFIFFRGSKPPGTSPSVWPINRGLRRELAPKTFSPANVFYFLPTPLPVYSLASAGDRTSGIQTKTRFFTILTDLQQLNPSHAPSTRVTALIAGSRTCSALLNGGQRNQLRRVANFQGRQLFEGETVLMFSSG